ncbi:MAG TPA: ABC transporter permease subunit [Acidimicrobiales bacterium]|nr:ABC transporter permease subunit [Acidimicrobiales bacterium]
MLRSVFGKNLFERRRSVLAWCVGLASMVVVMVAFFPTIKARGAEFDRLLADYPPALLAIVGWDAGSTISSPAGYLQGELFSMMIPILLMVAAIGAGATTIAGEEERGTLELLVAHPVSRVRIALEKVAAVVVADLLLGLVLATTLIAAGPAFDLHLGAAQIGAASLLASLVAAFFSVLALAVGAGTGRRGLAVGVTAGVGAAAYLLNSLTPLVAALRPWRRLSPFFYYAASEPLRHGFHWPHVVVLVAATAAAAVVAVRLFERRDLAV